MCTAPYAHETGLGHALYPRDHSLVSPRHLLLAIQRRSNNLLESFQVESLHCLGESVKNNHARVTVMDGYGQEVKFVHSGVVADTYLGIAVLGHARIEYCRWYIIS